jgi:peptidoglycan/xylan/chitin deacetylase (PgdA/CDA1 family)
VRSARVAAARRLVARACALIAPPRPGLRILTYHRVNDTHPQDRLSVPRAAFEEQLAELARSGRPVLALDAALDGAGTDAADALVLTFDDGYADNFTEAHPLLSRFGLPATFYVATGFLGTAEVMPRYAACCDDDRMMSWDEVRSLRRAGHCIGGHGRLHLELASLSAEAAREEIFGCARDVETALGERPRHFCYPRGSEAPQVRRIVAESGFVSATTVAPGTNPRDQDAFGLRRTEVSGQDTLEDFRAKLAGTFDAWHGLVQALRRVRAS